MHDKKFLPPIIFLLGIILLLGWYKFIYEPAQREILNMELETRRLLEIAREISALKTRHKNLETLIEAKELELDKARNYLPPTLMQDKFIDELYPAAELGDVRIISIQADEIISAEEVQTQIIRVKAEAEFVPLLNFIRVILDGERLTSLENISPESSGGEISCELSFKIFATKP